MSQINNIVRASPLLSTPALWKPYDHFSWLFPLFVVQILSWDWTYQNNKAQNKLWQGVCPNQGNGWPLISCCHLTSHPITNWFETPFCSKKTWDAGLLLKKNCEWATCSFRFILEELDPCSKDSVVAKIQILSCLNNWIFKYSSF